MKINWAKGFTLIELLIVIAVMGIMAGGVLVAINPQAKIDLAKAANAEAFSARLRNSLSIDLVGEWTFTNSNSSDTSGYNNITTTCPSFVADRKGQASSACSFNGTNNVNAGNGASLQDLPNVTVEAWVKPTATPTYGEVAGKVSYSNGGWILRISQGGNGRLTPHVYTNTWYTCSGPVIALNVWTHIALRYNGTTFKGYVNGVESCTVTPTVGGNLSSNSTAVWLGSNPGGGDYFSGVIDDVRIYRSALLSSQIKQLYVQGLIKHLLAFK